MIILKKKLSSEVILPVVCIPAFNLLLPGMEMVTNSLGSQVTIDGEDAENMNQLVRKFAYLNTREFSALDRRRLELSMAITYVDGAYCFQCSFRNLVLYSTQQQQLSLKRPQGFTEAFQRICFLSLLEWLLMYLPYDFFCFSQSFTLLL